MTTVVNQEDHETILTNDLHGKYIDLGPPGNMPFILFSSIGSKVTAQLMDMNKINQLYLDFGHQ